MLIAQLTDTHITVPQNENEDCYVKLEALQKCVLQINKLDPLPDVVIHTGDLSHNGRTDEYKLTKSIMDELKVPYLITAGNRDSIKIWSMLSTSVSLITTINSFFSIVLILQAIDWYRLIPRHKIATLAYSTFQSWRILTVCYVRNKAVLRLFLCITHQLVYQTLNHQSTSMKTSG